VGARVRRGLEAAAERAIEGHDRLESLEAELHQGILRLVIGPLRIKQRQQVYHAELELLLR